MVWREAGGIEVYPVGRARDGIVRAFLLPGDPNEGYAYGVDVVPPEDPLGLGVVLYEALEKDPERARRLALERAHAVWLVAIEGAEGIREWIGGEEK